MSASPIRVATLIDRIQNDAAGTERQLTGMLERFPTVGIEPHLVCLKSSPWLEQCDLTCPRTVLGYQGLLEPSLPRVLGRLRRFVRDEGIDVVQIFFEDSIFVSWLAFAGRSRRPVLLSSRRDIGLGAGQPWYHRIMDRLRPLALSCFDGVITNAQAAARFTAETDRVPRDRITVIHNGIELDVTPQPRPPVFDGADDSVWIVIAANFNPVKRHEVLIEALARVRDAAPERSVRVLLLGAGPREDAIRALVSEHRLEDRVVFEGSVPDVGPYLDHAHIGTLVSQREGLSNAILEYMKYGLPVVATDVGGNGELVDTENGALVPANDATALARAFLDLITDDARRTACGRASRARVERMCSWEATLGAYRSTYERLLGV